MNVLKCFALTSGRPKGLKNKLPNCIVSPSFFILMCIKVYSNATETKEEGEGGGASLTHRTNLHLSVLRKAFYYILQKSRHIVRLPQGWVLLSENLFNRNSFINNFTQNVMRNRNFVFTVKFQQLSSRCRWRNVASNYEA